MAGGSSCHPVSAEMFPPIERFVILAYTPLAASLEELPSWQLQAV